MPVLAFDGWYDAFLNGALRNFNGMRTEGANELARNNQRIVIGPWEHSGMGPSRQPRKSTAQSYWPDCQQPGQ